MLTANSPVYDSSMSVSDDNSIPCAENVFSCPGLVPPCVPAPPTNYNLYFVIICRFQPILPVGP
jgi:hypothetical protein